jgi:hypothetical protein
MSITGHAVIWAFGRRTSAKNLFHLIDGPVQTWRGGPTMDVFVDAPLANLFASYVVGHLGVEGAAELLDADDLATALYRRLAGYHVTVVRYRDCAITDTEIASARRHGVIIEVVDPEAMTAGSDR